MFECHEGDQLEHAGTSAATTVLSRARRLPKAAPNPAPGVCLAL